ncbi:hypothetical protein [Lactobacillus crispatus]|nr:hypothetical protein [Lactobacillus crispatus]
MKLAGSYYLENGQVILKGDKWNRVVLDHSQVIAVELLIKHCLSK